jgi:hypothetical protein
MKISEKITQKYEQKNKEITKILNPKKQYRIDFLKVGKTNQIGVFDGKKPVVIGDYWFYGIYQSQTKLWIWASSIPGVDKRHLSNIRKIKQSAHLFESDSDEKINFYYQLLTQDVIQIPNEKLLVWISDLLLYLSDDMFCFTPINNEANTQFITLAKINEKYV